MQYLDVIATSKEEIRLLGKSFWEDNTIALPWVDAGFTFSFRGQGAVIGFAPYQTELPVYLRVWVDERYSFRFAVSTGAEKISIDGLDENTVHTVRVLMVVRGAPLYINDIRLVGDRLAKSCVSLLWVTPSPAATAFWARMAPATTVTSRIPPALMPI